MTITPAQLPPDLSTFTGREADLAALDAMLADGQSPYAPTIVAIVGTAGVGKTALAVRWAYRIRHQFPDGQLFLDLAGHAPGPPVAPLEALSRVLRSLGVPPSAVPDDEREAAGLYRSLLAGRRMLVLLDNVRDSAHARQLLPASAGCLAVTTSRSLLDGLVARDDARRLPLDLLPPGEATTLLARIVGGRRVTAEAAAVAELAEACARLPLALRIAAADLSSRPHETVAGYVARLREGDGLSALAVRDDEQIAVRAAFELSYRALDAPVRRMFRCFGLVPGTEITAESGAAMLEVSRDESAGLLARLADAHLVVEREPGRFGCHDLLRLYATELAGGADGEAVLHRLLSWSLSTADAAADRLYPQLARLPLPETLALPAPMAFADHTEARAWFDAERTNLTESIRHASEHGLHVFAYSLADALRGYYWLCMRTIEWSVAVHAALSAAHADRHEPAEAAGHLSLGMLQWRLGRFEEAIREYHLALDRARRSHWLEGEASALGALGPVYRMTSRLGAARATMEQALELARRTGWAGGEAVNLGNLGLVLTEMGLLDEAVEHFQAALALARKNRAFGSQALVLTNLGTAYFFMGRLDEAHERLTEALQLHIETGSRGRAAALNVLALVHRDRGEREKAEGLANTALALSREPPEPRLEAQVLHTIGTLHGSADTLMEALRLAREAGDHFTEAYILIDLAGLGAGDPRELLAQARTIARACGYGMLEERCSEKLPAHGVEAPAR